MDKPVRSAGPCPSGWDCADRYDFGDGQILLVGRLVVRGLEGQALVRLPGNLLPGGDGTRNGPEVGVTGQVVTDSRREQMGIGRGEEAIIADPAELAAAGGAHHAGR